MHFRHRQIEYFLPDDWWAEAGMDDFVSTSTSFRVGPSEWPELPVFLVAVNDVAPLIRQGFHGVFNDNPDSGTARERVVRILEGFRDNSPIPPVNVARLQDGGAGQFKLIHGAHRFYCAVAAGFSHVPAVEVYDVWGASPG